MTGEQCYMEAADNNLKALEIFSEFGANLGEAIKMIMYTIDPQAIVLGGSVSKSYNFFQHEMWKTIGNFAYPNSVKKIKIEVSESNFIAILGAAALYFDAKESN
jgi:glucokinase